VPFLFSHSSLLPLFIHFRSSRVRDYGFG
jgi:hypothetical protein